MTKLLIHRCNLCGNIINDNTEGVGVATKSGGVELEEGSLDQFEDHLCKLCINATYDLSCRLRQKE